MGLPVKLLMLSLDARRRRARRARREINLAGVETQLRPDITLGLGYVGFLASWLGRHSIPKVVGRRSCSARSPSRATDSSSRTASTARS